MEIALILGFVISLGIILRVGPLFYSLEKGERASIVTTAGRVIEKPQALVNAADEAIPMGLRIKVRFNGNIREGWFRGMRGKRAVVEIQSKAHYGTFRTLRKKVVVTA